MNGLRWLAVGLALLLAAVIAFALVVDGDHSGISSNAPVFDPNGYGSAAKELVVKAIDERYDYNPEVGCPEQVEEVKGTTFICEALVRENLIPVTLEVVSPTGFIRVIEIG